MLCIHVKQAAP